VLDLLDRKQDVTGAPVAPVASPTKLKGIAVCGSHPLTKMAAPFKDPGYLIYACSPDNSPYGHPDNRSPLPRVTEFFEIHVPVFDRSRPYAYLQWLSQQPFRLWMRDEMAMNFYTDAGKRLFPNAVLYPEQELKDIFGPFTFTSSIAFMVAKAIADIERMKHEGVMGADGKPPELHLYGILQAGKEEYVKQRQGTQNMLWNATQAGIKVFVANESRLFEPPPEDF